MGKTGISTTLCSFLLLSTLVILQYNCSARMLYYAPSHTYEIGKNIDVEANCTVRGDTFLLGNVKIEKNGIVDGTLTVIGESHVEGDLSVDGGTVLHQNVTIKSHTVIEGEVSTYEKVHLVGPSLVVDGLSLFKNEVSLMGNVVVSDKMTVDGELSLTSSGSFVALGSVSLLGPVNMTLDSSHLMDNSITSAKLASNSVTSDKLASGSVTREKLAGDVFYTLSVPIAEGGDISVGDVVSIMDGSVHRGTVVSWESEGSTNLIPDAEKVDVSAINETHAIFVFGDGGNSGFTTLVLASVSGTNVSFGEKHVFNSAWTGDVRVEVLDSTHALIAFTSTNTYGYAVIVSFEGDDVTFGSTIVFNSAATYWLVIAAMDSSHVIMAYKDDGNSNYGTCIVAVVSGMDITFGTEAVFQSGSAFYVNVAKLDSTRALIAYEDASLYIGVCVVATVEGSSVSCGPAYTFHNAAIQWASVASLDAERVVIAYLANPLYNGVVRVATINGTAVSFGNPTTVSHSRGSVISVSALDSYNVLVGYDYDPSLIGATSVAVVKGNSVEVGAETVFTNQIYSMESFMSSTTLSNRKGFVACRIEDSSTDVLAFLTSLTPELNGTLAVSVNSGSFGDDANLVVCGVTDVHSGLVPGANYYTAPDGRISTMTGADDVYVGRALTDHNLLVKCPS